MIDNCNNDRCKWNQRHKCMLPAQIPRMFDYNHHSGQFFCRNYQETKEAPATE